MEIGSPIYNILTLVYILGFFILFAWLFYEQITKALRLSKYLKAYALAHGGKFEPAKARPSVSGLAIIPDTQAWDVVSVPTKYGADQFFSQVIQQENSNLERTCFAFATPLQEKHIFLDSKLALDYEMPALRRNRAYTLEGVFGRYFDLYFLEGNSSNALQIFSPDIMEDVLMLGLDYDMEFRGGWVYLVCYRKLTGPERIQAYERYKTLVDKIVAQRSRAVALAALQVDPRVDEKTQTLRAGWWDRRENRIQLIFVPTILVILGLLVMHFLQIDSVTMWSLILIFSYVLVIFPIIMVVNLYGGLKRLRLRRQARADLSKYQTH